MMIIFLRLTYVNQHNTLQFHPCRFRVYERLLFFFFQVITTHSLKVTILRLNGLGSTESKFFFIVFYLKNLSKMLIYTNNKFYQAWHTTNSIV